MNNTKACYESFNKMCEQLGQSDLVDLEECQYWLFELGYKAALEKQASQVASLAA